MSSNEFYEALQARNFDKLRELKNILKGTLNITMFVDTSLEEGDGDMFKFLVNEYGEEPSLYAKQMAHINGHHSLVTWIETMGISLRNNIGIANVHYKNGQWSDYVPKSYQFV